MTNSPFKMLEHFNRYGIARLLTFHTKVAQGTRRFISPPQWAAHKQTAEGTCQVLSSNRPGEQR